MSCDPRVVETSVSTIIAQVDEPCTTVAAIDTETAVVEQLIPGPQGPVGATGPQGAAGESYFWEPEAAEDLAPGQPCAINTLGQARLADATDSTKPALGLATVATSATMGALIQVAGPLTLADWSAATGGATLTVGATYYLDTAGQLALSPPAGAGRSLQEVGRALAADTLLIHITNYGRRA